VRLAFKLPYRCSFGQELCLVGSGDELGNWSLESARSMKWTDGDVWQVEFEVTAGCVREHSGSSALFTF
jgi:Starch binding domain